MLPAIKFQFDHMFPLIMNDALAGPGWNHGPFCSPKLPLQHVRKGLVHEHGPAQAACIECVSVDWLLENKIDVCVFVIVHTLAFDTLSHHHRANVDNLVADEISSAAAAVDNYKDVAGLKPK